MALSLCPEATKYLALSGRHGQQIANAINGSVDNASSHFQPSVGIMNKARRTSKHAPSAQKHLKDYGWFFVTFGLKTYV